MAPFFIETPLSRMTGHALACQEYAIRVSMIRAPYLAGARLLGTSNKE
jgi:hypothetical protein